LADISLAKDLLGYKPAVKFEEGLEITIEYFKKLYF
jgi:nucleoside-diphosphate-sugar epimerase